MFSTLKHHLGAKNWIRHSDLQSLSEKVPYTSETLRVRLPQLVARGYVVRMKSGFLLRSIKKVASEKFGVNTKFRYIYVVGETKLELSARVSYLSFRSNARKQAYLSMKKEGTAESKAQKSRCTLANGEHATVSVRWVASTMGYTSASTGSKMEKAWEDYDLVEIKRSNSFLCKVDVFKAMCVAEPKLLNKSFVIGNDVYVRNINQISMK